MPCSTVIIIIIIIILPLGVKIPGLKQSLKTDKKAGKG